MKTPIHAVLVSVNYTDILRLTLPYNRHHFASVTVVTSPADFDTLHPVTRANDASVFITDAFTRDGATFNKWLALEEGLEFATLRDDKRKWADPLWVCLMDADVVWPRDASLERILRPGMLYAPRRRMVIPAPSYIPAEEYWPAFPLHPQDREFAGYTQVFRNDDPCLPSEGPWHETDWRHAGGADSFFQARWPNERKVRPDWTVLHLGPAGVNWCGRTTPDVETGEVPPEAHERLGELHGFLIGRRAKPPGRDRFSHERLGG